MKSIINQEQVINDIKNHIFIYFTKSAHTAKNISKEEIDEAQIVYRYLNSHAEDGLIIPINGSILNKMTRLRRLLESSLVH